MLVGRKGKSGRLRDTEFELKGVTVTEVYCCWERSKVKVVFANGNIHERNLEFDRVQRATRRI